MWVGGDAPRPALGMHMTRSDDQLLKHQSATETLLGNLPGMAYRCRIEPGRPMEYVSGGANELTGYPPEAIVCRHDGFVGLVHADDRDAFSASIDSVPDPGTRFQLTYRILAADGAETWVWDQWQAVTSPDGSGVVLEGFMTDATERVVGQHLLEHRLHALTRVAASQTFDQPLEKMLNLLAACVVEVTRAVACVVVLIDEELDLYRVVGIHGMPDGYGAAVEAAYRAGANLSSVEAYRTRKPVQRTIRGYMASDPLQTQVYALLRNADWNTIASIPLVYRDGSLGAMSCSYPIGMEPDEAEIAFLQTIADQAAVAVQTARLFAEVQSKAALEERQRLARELHDSVSQALYGIGLGARTARTLLDRDPSKVAEPLDFVVSLAEVALTEMRALIFELRPDALEAEGLVGLLEQQVASLRSRHGLHVEMDVGLEPDVSPAVKEMLYRIAQESLHNTTKHAQARNVTLRLRQEPDGIVLEITDDGIGFDPSSSVPGHLGLRSIRERAAGQGAIVDIESAAGHGARTRVLVPVLT
jgi:signal transduction histidine kinase